MRQAKRIRWSNNDQNWGPFTYARGGYCPLGIMISSGDNDERVCQVRLSGFGHTLISPLPPILRPWRQWVDTSKYHWASERGGFWDVHRREYGFSLVKGALHLHFGRQTHDSRTDQNKCYFLPWQQWRHVRHSLYDLDGNHFADMPERGSYLETLPERERLQDACPKRVFAFDDYDGERIEATTRIEEREWRFGTGWWRWLSWFRKPNISRSLDIRFSKETGKRKGSWKGGTVGHSIEMLPGELHAAAFRRYCAEHEMTLADGDH